MRALLRSRDALVILPTGAGKSAVYQVPATLVAGPTLVVSPLLALQYDQIAGLNDRGVAELRAVRISSAQTPKQQTAAVAELRSGQARLLFITPEQLASPTRLAEIKALRPALVAIDEAHCISTWGRDFRPDYLALGHVIRELGHPPVVALTATASPPVRDDIVERLGLRRPAVIIGGLDRPNLFLEAIHCPTEDHRWRRLLTLLDRRPGAGIIYVPTRRLAEDVAARLRKAGYPAADYHAGLAASVRKARHEQFDSDETPIIVATSAFGMGIDKPNIRFVVHMALPDSPDSYLQEIGRAGRDGEAAHVLLLYRTEDIALQRFFAGGTPNEHDLLYVASGVRAGVRTKAELADSTGMSARKIATLLSLLEAVGAATTGQRGEIRLPRYAPEPDEASRLAVAEAERHQTLQRSRTDMMRGLAETSGCRVQPLLTYFGEQMSRPCGHCDNCARASVTDPRGRRSRGSTVARAGGSPARPATPAAGENPSIRGGVPASRPRGGRGGTPGGPAASSASLPPDAEGRAAAGRRGTADPSGRDTTSPRSESQRSDPRRSGAAGQARPGETGRAGPETGPARRAPNEPGGRGGARATGGPGPHAGQMPYPLHSTVSHRHWGRGTVLGYDDDRMTVLFEEVGYKTLSVAVVRNNGLLAAADGDESGGGRGRGNRR
jgi:ATP-dependent DNA helicase RecQ